MIDSSVAPVLDDSGGAALPSTARDRIDMLCDPRSFMSIRSSVLPRRATSSAQAGDGIIAGIGRVDGRSVACYAQDSGHLAGALGEAHAETIHRIMDIALEARIPIVSFIASGGARIQEGTAALAGYGQIFRSNVALSRVVPQISVITGLSAGGSCYSPALTDFVVMTRESAMFLTGPRIVYLATGEQVTVAELGGHRTHERNGVADFVSEDGAEAALLVRQLLGYLPSHSGGLIPPVAAVPTDGSDPSATVPRSHRMVYDMRQVARAIVDQASLFEVRAGWARNVVTAFARIEGRTVGIVANQPSHIGGVLDVDASQKAALFVEQCDKFGLPLVVLVDTPGFMPGRRQESAGVIRFGATLVRAFSGATVPRFTVVVRKAFGGAYIAMNSKHLGATFAFAWPEAEIGIMSAHSAVEIVHRKNLESAPDRGGVHHELAEAYREEHLKAGRAAAGGFVDEVIAPEETRQRLSWALSAMSGEGRPAVEVDTGA